MRRIVGLSDKPATIILISSDCLTGLSARWPFIYGAIMNRKNLKKTYGKQVTVRLGETIKDDFEGALATGATKTEIVLECLRRALPELREELRQERLEALTTKAQPTPQKSKTAHSPLGIQKHPPNSAQSKKG